jgi:hypothetical protein
VRRWRVAESVSVIEPVPDPRLRVGRLELPVKRVLFTVLVLALLFGVMAACNTVDLTPGAPHMHGTPSPHASTTTMPTPSSSPVITLPTDHDCGNADFQVMDYYDPDDPAGFPDSYWCYWLCAIDLGNPANLNLYPPDPDPPHEVWKRYDLDAPVPAYQFDVTKYLPCYSAYPRPPQ